MPDHVDDLLAALRASHVHLCDIVAGLRPEQLVERAYPSQWTIADVLSHMGSGAQILRQRVDDSVAGRDTADGFAPSVWDAWNAKSPQAQVADALVSDAALIDRLESLTADERALCSVSMGPVSLDVVGLVGLRLNEHAVHTWDVEVVLDPSATVSAGAIALMIDNLELIARFAGKPTGSDRTVRIHTTAPARDFTITLTTDALTFAPGDAGGGEPDLVLTSEAFVRLFYGRLDPGHTLPFDGERATLDELRRAFPGF